MRAQGLLVVPLHISWGKWHEILLVWRIIVRRDFGKYTIAVSKLSKLQSITLDDHLWLLNSRDQSNVLVVKLLCAEDFGSNSGIHSKTILCKRCTKTHFVSYKFVAILEFVWLHLQRCIVFGAISSVVALAILAPTWPTNANIQHACSPEYEINFNVKFFMVKRFKLHLVLDIYT